jgi:hypothetical protein
MRKVIGFILTPFLAFSQVPKKSITTHKVSAQIEVDGVLNDSVWINAPMAEGFRQFNPGNGEVEPKNQKTQVKVVYSDQAIYIGAIMYDNAPDSILTQLTARDNYNQNNDWFGVFINPFNDGLSDFNFWVTAAGVQADSRTTNSGDDFSWNTVWESAVKITDFGWVCEIEIPYMSLRFPDNPRSDWGINMIRSVRRTREQFSWNFLDRFSGFTFEYQSGLLHGMEDIHPPVRLSLNPYLSSYIDNYEGVTTNDFNAGLDLKYGIDESFTLDMTLIPDFGQVAFDPQVLNLSPFENRFQENRLFFTEGANLFNKGDIFYSRRIGGAPENITGVDLSASDSVDIRQEFTQLLNATKISGQTKNNLGIGFLNAVTDNNYAILTDEEGNETRSLTEPWTNYNVLVLDQRFQRKSSVSLVNTNVWRNGDPNEANTTALLGSYFDKSGEYRIDGAFKMSNVISPDSIKSGYQTEVKIADVGGLWRWQLRERITTDTYDINDLGFQPRNNLVEHHANISYGTVAPSGVFNRYEFSSMANYTFLYNPNVYENLRIRHNAFFLLRSFFAFSVNTSYKPFGGYDYFESRTSGVEWRVPRSFSFGGFLSSDYRKVFALDARFNYEQISEFNNRVVNITLEPRIRFSDRFFMVLRTNLRQNVNNYGFAQKDDFGIFFGRRNIDRIQNTITANYVVNPTTSFSLNFRHLWTAVKYQQYYRLEDDGELIEDPLFPGINDINFNTWNLDFRFSWWFAPGSEMVILFRNSIASNGNNIQTNYFENINNLLNSPQQNNISLRLTYFLDYNTLRKKLRK